MIGPRPRGSRVAAASPSTAVGAPRHRPASAATAAASQELLRTHGTDVVDHGLRRRAVLLEVATGRTSAQDHCDAHPHLLAAARHYGVRLDADCPLCRSVGLRWVHFVYGTALKHVAGQAKVPGELRRMAELSERRDERFHVYLVEVCLGCRWNHLVRSFVLGAGARDAAREPRTERKTPDGRQQ